MSLTARSLSLFEAVLFGCKAGSLAGLLLGLLTVALISPVILKAELFEQPTADAVEAGHHHDAAAEEFTPNDWQRPVLTVVGAWLIGISFGILASVVVFLGLTFDFIPAVQSVRWWKAGLLFGGLGFLIFQGIPALGLKPELPGIVGAEGDFAARQTWWLISVVCSTAGLVVFALIDSLLPLQKLLRRSVAGMACAGLALVPFWLGVPVHSEVSTTPEPLRHQFLVLSLGINAGFWLLLGGFLFYFLTTRQENKAA